MTQHHLLNRTEDEVLWFQRRSFLQGAAAWVAAGGFAAAHAQERSNVVELQGQALCNGQPLAPWQSVQTGDDIQTGPDSRLVFVIGGNAFMMRQNSRLQVERGLGLYVVSMLRLLTGAVASVWGKGQRRLIVTPTLTAGIRGTGVYTEIMADQDNRAYFCNCYGTVDLNAGGDTAVSVSDYHQSFWGEVRPNGGRLLTPAKALNHTDEEMESLARLVSQRTAWEILGRKGVKDGKGYMNENAANMHPAGSPLQSSP